MIKRRGGELIGHLFALALHGKGSSAVKTTELLLSYGYGRPPRELSVSGPGGGPIGLEFRSATRQALMDVIAAHATDDDDEEANEQPEEN